MRCGWSVGAGFTLAAALAANAGAQTPFTWTEILAKFETANPTLRVDQLGVDESKANEISAFLRPNPQLSVTADQIGHNDAGRPFADMINVFAVNYLHERQHKRELRRDSAKQATDIAVSSHGNLDRTLVFTLRSTFVQVLMSKAALTLARDNLAFYDRVLAISRDRYQAGDLAQIDMDRLELQRVQFESAVEAADVTVRTAKIQLLMLLDDRTALERFDVSGPFDFTERMPSLDDVRRQALDARPDLRAALQAFEQASTNHRLAIANGSTDPTIGVDAAFPIVTDIWQSYPAPLRQYVGVNVSIPLRIFDQNQGEKLRTQIDIDRNQRLVDVTRAQVFSDVDSGYATLVSTLNVLRPYRDHYLTQSTRVRDTVTFSYQNGGASLLDFLQAEQDYRSVQLNYLNLIGTYLTAAAQLNMAVGREVIP